MCITVVFVCCLDGYFFVVVIRNIKRVLLLFSFLSLSLLPSSDRVSRGGDGVGREERERKMGARREVERDDRL